MSTFLEKPDGQPRPKANARPSFPRSNSTPLWAKNASLESLSSSLTPQPHNLASALRKRHSTYVLSSPPDQSNTSVPVPVVPPQRPLRNPARLALPALEVQSKVKNKNRRPHTAASTREDITPWEFMPGPASDDTRSPSETGSLLSRARHLAPTGPVSEVTPWELYPVRQSATSGSANSTTTGTIEEVTPWELHPVPSIIPSRSTLATGPIEEVTPWDLVPAPPSAETRPLLGGKQLSSRASTSSGQSRTFPDLHIRKRKSTGAKPLKSRSNTVPGATVNKSSTPGIGSTNGYSSSPLQKPDRLLSPQPTPAAPGPARKVPSHPPAPPLGLSAVDTSDPLKNSPRNDLKFSTADRTILEELKRNIKARESQFVLKGDESALRRALGSQGKRHHAFPQDEVPYPRNYERDAIDLDVWETMFCQEICNSLTWHVFEIPPAKVLDIGCGTGTWVLNCARDWKESHFVGLDIVPLQPDLHQVGSLDLASRITWVHSNFLDGLPFPNDEFDFVHVKRIALGVPEDKWDFLLEEITRVMKPGGAFQMLEEDLFFPGRRVDGDGDSESHSDSEQTPPTSTSQNNLTRLHSYTNLETLADESTHSPLSDEESALTPTTSFLETPSRPNSPVKELVIDEDTQKEMAQEEEAQELLAHVIGGYSVPLEQPSIGKEPSINDAPPFSATRQSLHVKTPSQRARALSYVPTRPAFTQSAVSLNTNGAATDMVLGATFKPKERTRPRGYSLTTTLPRPIVDLNRLQNYSPMSSVLPIASESMDESIDNIRHSRVLTGPKAPTNPRDHSLLELIYNQLLESRFINQSPLALLTNAIGLYLKDVRTHPPLQYRFPAIPQKALESKAVMEKESLPDLEDGNSDSDGARDAILPSPVSRVTKKRNSRRISTQSYEEETTEVISEGNRYVDVQSLLRRSTPYITLDSSRSSALSPSVKNMFPGMSSTKVQRNSFLPNTTMNIDLKTLNLHLALRVAEIVACSESMWEWVLKYQAEAKSRKAPGAAVRSHRLRSGSVETEPHISINSTSSLEGSSDLLKESILQLERDTFDELLRQFEMDMRDKYSLGSCLGERLAWFPVPTAPSAERKQYEDTCQRWHEWELEQLKAATPSASTDAGQVLSQPKMGNGHDKRTTSEKSNHVSSKTTSELSPTHRMSRVMRVFVGWKALDP